MEDVRKTIQERQKKLSEVIEKKAKLNLNVEKAQIHASKKKVKFWKNRISFGELQKRYLQDEYAAKLVHCKKLDAFDPKRNFLLCYMQAWVPSSFCCKLWRY